MSFEDIIETSHQFDTLDGVKDSNVVLSCWPGLLYKNYDLTFKSPGYRSSQNISRLYSDEKEGLAYKKFEYGFGLAVGAAINVLMRASAAVYAASKAESSLGKASAGIVVFFSPEIASTLTGIAKTLYRRYEIHHMT